MTPTEFKDLKDVLEHFQAILVKHGYSTLPERAVIESERSPVRRSTVFTIKVEAIERM